VSNFYENLKDLVTASNDTSRQFRDIWSVMTTWTVARRSNWNFWGDQVPGLRLKGAAQTVATVVQTVTLFKPTGNYNM
jgi:hypothetical protein